MDVASRASKKAPLGLFCPPDCTAGRCCSNPSAFVSFTHTQNKKLQRSSYVEAFFGGRGWIRTTEAEKQQIYSLSPLATREHAQIQFLQPQLTACISYHLASILSTDFLKKISIKVQLFRKTLRLHGFCFLLASPIPLIVCRFSPCVRFTIMTSSNRSHFPGVSQRIQKQKSHDTHRCFNGISQDFFGASDRS